jgi:hypothetical protein
VALKRTDIAGGAPRQIADVEDGAGGTWNKRGLILFGTVSHGLFTVADDGGAVTPLHVPGDNGVGRMPVFLPDDRYFLYWNRRGQTAEGDIRVASLDGNDGTVVASAVRSGGLIGSHLLFARGETLFAQPFDVSARTTAGPAVAIADGIAVSSSGGYASFAASDTGVLLLAKTMMPIRQARWVDRTGARTQPVDAAVPQIALKLSPDEQQALFVRPDISTGFKSLWSYDLQRRNALKLAAGGQPVFSADGKWIAFLQMPTGVGIGRIRSDGTGRLETLLPRIAWPSDWSRDGRKLLTYYPDAETGLDIGVLNVETHQMTPLIKAAGAQVQPRYSPDEDAIAYVSTESGQMDVFIRSLSTGELLLVSNGAGGSQPHWRRDGEELFYLGADRKLMTVKIAKVGGHWTAGTPTPLFQLNVVPAAFFGLTTKFRTMVSAYW